MQHFVSFSPQADFGIVKQQNKLRKRFVTEWLGNKYPYVKPQDIGRYTKEPKPLGDSNDVKTNIKYGRRALNEISERAGNAKDRTSSPVSGGNPKLDYVPNNYNKIDLVSKANAKTIINSLDGKNPKKLAANKNIVRGQIGDSFEDDRFIDSKEAKEIGKYHLQSARYGRKEIDEPTKFLPIHQSKNERLDFSPTRQQLNDVYTKHYEKDNGGANKYDPKLITGSANHTWLTADGQYMEVPVGQQEMPLNSNMWKGRISGKRLPAQEIKGIGEIGSPVRGISGSQLKGERPMYDMSHKLVQTSDNYNNQIANKRYVPNE